MPSRRSLLLAPLLAAAGSLLANRGGAAGETTHLRIALVADVHHSRANVGFKASLSGRDLLRDFVARCNDRQPDLVISAGDLIEEIDAATDRALAREVREIFAKLDAPLLCVPGNHDVRHIGIEEWEAIFGRGSFTSRSVDRNGFHIVLFCPIAPTGPYTFSAAELEWLRADLAATMLPTIIITHVPIHASSLSGNGYFAAGGNGEWINGDAARAIIRNSATICVLQGHTHWNAWHVEDDIHYVTIPSLTETRRTMPNPSGSTAMIEIGADHIAIEINGRDSMAYRLRRRTGTSTWA